MRIAIGSDRRGYRAKIELIAHLKNTGHDVKDFGCDRSSKVDAPDIAGPVAVAVAHNEFSVGVLVGGIGAGMCIAANKVRGARAAVGHDEFVARRSRETHLCNIICVAAELDGIEQMIRVVDQFVGARPDSTGHPLLADKLSKIEQINYDAGDRK